MRAVLGVLRPVAHTIATASRAGIRAEEDNQWYTDFTDSTDFHGSSRSISVLLGIAAHKGLSGGKMAPSPAPNLYSA